jgi:hypothetical protein
MIELDLIQSPNQSFKFKDFDITIRLTKNDTYIQIVKNGDLILPFIRIIPFKDLLQFGEYDFDFVFEATNKNEKIDYKKFGITQRFYYYDK